MWDLYTVPSITHTINICHLALEDRKEKNIHHHLAEARTFSLFFKVTSEIPYGASSLISPTNPDESTKASPPNSLNTALSMGFLEYELLGGCIQTIVDIVKNIRNPCQPECHGTH